MLNWLADTGNFVKALFLIAIIGFFVWGCSVGFIPIALPNVTVTWGTPTPTVTSSQPVATVIVTVVATPTPCPTSCNPPTGGSSGGDSP